MNAYIQAISYYLPPATLTNDDLARRFPEWPAEKVAAKVGVTTRHVAAPGQTAGDMAEAAARRLFDEHGADPASIDFLLLCTQSPDHFLPPTACLLQHRLGLPTTAGALDYDLGCSGYVYGLALAKGLIAAGVARRVLLLTADTYSRYLHPDDKGCLTIFGDAAAATLVGTEGRAEIGQFQLGTDGAGAHNLIVQNGAARHPALTGACRTEEGGHIHSDDHLWMNGTEVFCFTLDALPGLIDATLAKNQLAKDDIDLWALHQANQYMLTTLRRHCGLPRERFLIDMDATGNTVSSSLPLVLARADARGELPAGARVLAAGFGVGYSWGATVLRF